MPSFLRPADLSDEFVYGRVHPESKIPPREVPLLASYSASPGRLASKTTGNMAHNRILLP